LGCKLGGGGECSGWRWRAASHGEFLQGQVVLHLQEGGEGAGTPQQNTDVREALVETTKHVEDEGAVGDNLSQGGEIVGHLLQTTTVLGDREITLYEVVKLRLELDRPCLSIAQELGFDGEPGVPGSGALGGDDFGKVVGEESRIQDLTTQSIRSQSDEGAGAARTCAWRENLPRTSRN
jgi:hypothetical protein